MKKSLTDHNKEFEDMVGHLSETIHEMSDPVAIASMLYNIAEEKKSSNLVIRAINGKFDNIMEKLDKVTEQLEIMDDKFKQGSTNRLSELSDRDVEVLNFTKEMGRVCAEDVQKHFNYKGKNAASARLSKLFKEGKVEKIYAGRNVYYTPKA